jgi:hypothetical protein
LKTSAKTIKNRLSNIKLEKKMNIESIQPPFNVPPEWGAGENLDPVGISTVEFIVEREAPS